ncbi:S41 family peptidase [Pedobacter miscanthi]|uniref:Peptidase S41 protein n=1 Tax=Pedobacter miscanthi TaxID=2259170 RepID=A0A366L0N0_9SPHI|nr:S41 family peptidase [Pedobacter miscanthi]RBQ06854.1 peptidase S41 protein [Pedobacter miscanthi]
MKKIILLFFTISLSANLFAQGNKSASDSIAVFYDQLFINLKRDYLFKKTVDWKVVESHTRQNLTQYRNFESSLGEISMLFDEMGANHCIVFYKGKKYAGTGNKVSDPKYSEQWKKKYVTKPGFEAKMLNNKYGYILMPNMVFFDNSAENIHKIAQPLYDQIARLKMRDKPIGWIIDLRFNTGGNSTPMLLALYDFLGNNNIWSSLNINGKVIDKAKLNNGKYLNNGRTLSFISPEGDLLDGTKVAVITGVLTASSGEVTALAFKGRPNTIFIGETTAGFTTGNIFCALPFGTTMALTKTFDGDRNDKYHQKMIPDILVSKHDNFDDLLLDKNIEEAIKFLNSQ